jgi:hypothetical protein
MTKGPSGQKRPADPIARAVQIMRIATGEAEEAQQTQKDPAAVALGKKGGLKGGAARAKALSPEERSRIAKNAAKKRWGKSKT